MNNDIRINIPQKNIDKFKEILLYILSEVGARPNVGKTVICKLLYFIDFDYYELYEEQLMGLSYIKNTFGPTPVEFDEVIQNMIKAQDLEIVSSNYYTRYQTKYLPIRKPKLDILKEKELNHINNILKKYADKTANQLSEISHKDIPWIGTKDKEIINYESVFYRTPETSVRSYEV